MKMENRDPYRKIARLFPLFDFVMDVFMRRTRRDLVRILKYNGLKSVLDLGCGAGGLSRVLADRGFSPVCYDVSPAMVRQSESVASRSPTFPVILGKGELRFPQIFDASIMRFVFHEMDPETRESTWTGLQRVVRPGGLLVFIDFLVPQNSHELLPAMGSYIINLIESQMNRIHVPHHANFVSLMREGGTLAWIMRHGAELSEVKRYFGANIGLIAVRNR